MSNRSLLRRVLDHTGERGMYLFCWALFCSARANVVDVYSGTGNDYSVFYNFIPYYIREALWISAAVLCFLGFLIRNETLRVVAYCVTAFAIMQRAAGYLNAYIAWVIPEPPDSEFTAFWGFVLNIATLMILLTTLLLTTEKEEANGT